MKEDWTLSNLPPEGHVDVSDFFYMIYETALGEQERLKIRERLLDNHAMFRGKFDTKLRKRKVFTPINLFFANVERTVANITANNPTAEVIDMDGIKDSGEELMGARVKQWWKQTGQRSKLKESADNMEIYGYTVEKVWWNDEKQEPDCTVKDPFGVIPAPGIWKNWSEDMPYLVFLEVDYVDSIEKMYEVDGVASDEPYALLGESREENRPRTQTLTSSGVSSKTAHGKYSVAMSPVSGKSATGEKPFQRGLVIEIWIRGATGKIKESKPMLDPEGNPITDPLTDEFLFEEITKEKYPDGIRKVTIARKDIIRAKDKSPHSYLVLDDSPNIRLVNPKLAIEIAKTTYSWGRFPCLKTDSYSDSNSSYGFSAGEQTADLLIKISNIFTRLFAYVDQALSPTLIIEANCGITKEMIQEQVGQPRLVLMPWKPQADIRFLQTPNLPTTFFNVLNVILQFYDRIYQIEDADRGKSPSRITAASAIVALQERNAILMQSKVESIEYVASERGKWAIGLWQNFGTREEFIDVNENQETFRGINFAGRRFNYQIEVGSTVPKTSLRIEEQIRWLAPRLDLRTILETLGIPNWKNIVERNGETQLDMALNILIQAGMPKELALEIKQTLMQSQGGPGDVSGGGGGNVVKAPDTVSPGTPRALQGGKVPENVRGAA